MKVGISTFVTDDGIGAAPLAKAIEERGFDSVFIAEHTHIPASRKSPYPGGGDLPLKYYKTLDPFVTLTAMAMVTERLLLGTGVALLMERDTLTTAKEAASVDFVSGGRLLFGVGVGWNREEMANHGTDPKTRGKLVDEQLAAIKEIWTNDPAEYHGEFVDFDPIYSRPKCVQQPHAPIYVGGGEAAFDRTIAYGDAWLANGLPPEKLAPLMQELNEKAGREIPVSVFGGLPENLEAYRELGVERVLLGLETAPEKETLQQLDELAGAVETVR
ncbi:LLM class F420-dependent oxidoreductase [Rubrobacter indicoceani]|uniref:LLM class F420-dependent oxidoreductase n=1 Tax=Rubrobacter indicoceani TaxID=2051957 RepID=UPI000E5AFCCE|nr:LLM class F420-dependent oxidoreductase [Rubrobacter indicoceani]